MEHTLLPRNVERRQWVNRYYRIKVLPNVAEYNSSHVCAKAQRQRKVCRANFRVDTRRFLLCSNRGTGGGSMDSGPEQKKSLNEIKGMVNRYNTGKLAP